MKRCPTCEFVYEDDQSCCDMDGIDLIFDHKPLPGTVALEPRTRVTKLGFRRLAVVSVVGVILGIVVSALGHSSFERAVTLTSDPALPPVTIPSQQPLHDRAPVRRPAKPSPISESAAENLAASTITSLRAKTPRAPKPQSLARNYVESRPARNSKPLPRTSPGGQTRTAGTFVRQEPIATAQAQPPLQAGKPETAHVRKDSKLVSIVKKTGRFLTKPFRL